MRCAAPVHGQSTAARERTGVSHRRQRKRGQRAGGRISHRAWPGAAAAPISFSSSQQSVAARGQRGSSRPLPLSLSFHHLPPTRPLLTTELPPCLPLAPHSHRRLQPSVISHPLPFFPLLYDFHIFLPSICSPHRLAFLLVAIVRHHARAFLFHTSLGNSGFCHFETLC